MYLPFGPNSKIDTQLYLKKVIKYQIKNPRYDYEIAVALKESNTLIGACGIHVTDPNNKESSIGYFYDKQYWRNGYASEAANIIINFGFKELYLHNICYMQSK